MSDFDPVRNGVGKFASPGANSRANSRVDLLDENSGDSPEQIRARQAERAAENERIAADLATATREYGERTGRVIITRDKDGNIITRDKDGKAR